ncbi:SH3 domain-containing protein [uncultured Tenacibaculum sp.]|uniref:SH3 domain-containing protein n=1 Tax=uncultured Tenacibaculum sp. TaxID=174713 RepID=UPI00261BA78B|nr:hypothetical protein [uncultured Tenacibaculum sp.]
MKNNFIIFFIILTCNFCFAQKNQRSNTSKNQCNSFNLRVYVTDLDREGTNIREKAKGKVLLKLKGDTDYYMLSVIKAKKGWFKVKKIWGVDWGFIELSDEVGWIHYSVIGAATRRKVNVLSIPKTGEVLGKIDQETSVKIKDMCSGWVKIESGNIAGWISSEWLCGNPVTTCP